ncbi:hypothetical protein BX600DRAFT_504149 [Xylariales sp. PMI_506]|nr:hypothetical protein BX600DRAFT_504149 [Xylariales sp. PMI_506]
MASRDLVFIPMDDRGKARSSDRKLIRSRCMNGRNYRIGVGPVRETKVTVPTRSSQPTMQMTYRDPFDAQGEARYDECFARLTVPLSPCSDLSIVADGTDAEARFHLAHFLSHKTHILYPVELCIDLDGAHDNGVRWIFEDTAYLYCTLFLTSIINDRLMRRDSVKSTYYYLGRTIASVNQSLARSKIGDSTVAVVISLVILSAFVTDYHAAKAHFLGLQQIVRLRGGLGAFLHDPRLYIRLARVDLIYALHTGDRPLFADAILQPYYSDTTSPSSLSVGSLRYTNVGNNSIHGYLLVGRPHLPSIDSSDLQTRLPRPLERLIHDTKLSNVFHDLQYLSNELNNRHRLQDIDFKISICLIQYRLLLLKPHTSHDAVSECLRLAMLVFFTTTIQIPEGAGERYPYLACQYRESCCQVLSREERKPDNRGDLLMWLLLIGAMSLYGLEEKWLCEGWRKVVPADITWSEARNRLKELPWIDTVHDSLGKEAFEMLHEGYMDEATAKKRNTSAWWLSGWGICPLEL